MRERTRKRQPLPSSADASISIADGTTTPRHSRTIGVGHYFRDSCLLTVQIHRADERRATDHQSKTIRAIWTAQLLIVKQQLKDFLPHPNRAGVYNRHVYLA